jgi:Flp pilus assembly protein TadG
MANWLEFLKRFRSDERGNIAMLFGLSLVPIVGAATVVVDQNNASNTRTALQTEADATALEAAKAAVDIFTNGSLTAAQKQTQVDAKIAQVIAVRTSIASGRSAAANNTFAYSGQWVDSLKTEFRVTASVNVQRYARVIGSQTHLPVAASATAKLQFTGVTTTATPTITNPGYEAGDYNRIYAYCFNKDEPVVANQRSKMTVISSNGTDGGSGPSEMSTNTVFQNVVMPSCDAVKGETLSWRLYNVRGQRTNKSKWPTDSNLYNPPSNYTPATDKSGVSIYNHYSDTLIDPVSGVESYQFRGDAFSFYAPITMMETFVCDSQAACTPGGAGSIIPSQNSAPYNMPKNRKSNQSSLKCAPGKFMYIGWEDRPFLPKTNAPDYSDANSYQWTDSDYDDIRLVVSCPETTINYTSKVTLKD